MRWAKLVVHLLATAALWVRIQTSFKIQNGRRKQRSGQHTLLVPYVLERSGDTIPRVQKITRDLARIQMSLLKSSTVILLNLTLTVNEKLNCLITKTLPKSNGGDEIALELEAGSGLDALPGEVEQLRLAVHVIRLQADHQVTTSRHKDQIKPVLRIRIRDPVPF
jgi:hypothetical protein